MKHVARGFTLIELLVGLAVFGTLIGVASTTLFSTRDPLREAVLQVEGGFRQARSRAMASTSAYRLTATPTGFIAESAGRCGAADWDADTRYTVALPEDVVFVDPDWQICFNSRGVADQNLDLQIQYTDPRTNEEQLAGLTVFLGGAIAADI